MRTMISILLLGLVSCQAIAGEITGPARIIDGDTIEIRKGGREETVRLHGIDAPETGQTCLRKGERYRCGIHAREILAALVEGQPVTCVWDERDPYGRAIGVCAAGDVELNAAMVRSGWALAFRRYSTDYLPQEQSARQAKAGLWAGRFDAPWDFRAGQWTVSTGGAPDPDCPIKGNINRDGERIYHPPWSDSYARTKIDTAKGERWFCSEGEARAAGWRPPRR